MNDQDEYTVSLSPWINEYNTPGPVVVDAPKPKAGAAELYKICQAEVIKRLAGDPKNKWRVDHIEEALKSGKYEGSSMELLAHETAILMEKYF
jgi:hypothetical protein